MPAAFTIPTKFTAVDNFSHVVQKMGNNLYSFVSKADAGISKVDRVFRKLTPTLSKASKDLLSFATTAAIAGSIVSGINFSIKAIKDYETAVQSFRTIVSDATDKEFAKYREGINLIARQTKKSAVDVAASFEKIAGLNEKFAETAEGISAVSEASIILSKASGDELGQSAENLVGIMNQFGFAANEANRTINVLAAGAGVGSASIGQTSESFKNFGSVANASNIILEESVALVQTLGKFSIFGAEAGTKLRGSILKLKQAGLGYASGQFNINDALQEASSRFSKLRTAKEKDAFMNKVFQAENIVTGEILLKNIDVFNEFKNKVTGTNEAIKQAEIRSNTLTNRLDELKNTWVNIITSSEGAGGKLEFVKNVIVLLTDNLESIASIGVKVLLFFAAWKVFVLASSIAMGAFNIIIGIQGALMGVASIAIGKSTIALGAYKTMVFLVAVATKLWAIATNIGLWPLTLLAIGIAAVIALIVVIIKKYDEWGAALSLLIPPLGIIINLIQSFRRHWDSISKAFTKGDILGGIKAIGIAIFDAILMPLEQMLSIISKLTGFEWAENATKSIAKLRNSLENSGISISAQAADNGPQAAPPPLINPEQNRRDILKEIIQTNNAKVTLDINDSERKIQAKNNNPNMVEVNIGSTWAQF